MKKNFGFTSDARFPRTTREIRSGKGLLSRPLYMDWGLIVKMIVKIKDGRLELPKPIQDKLHLLLEDELLLIEESDRLILQSKQQFIARKNLHSENPNIIPEDVPLSAEIQTRLDLLRQNYEQEHPEWAARQRQFREHTNFDLLEAEREISEIESGAYDTHIPAKKSN
jgi:bifunctional DNA-binding transcriptional regulator/antitoxin component of YhaV-PrlF toxin-antitoxin module